MAGSFVGVIEPGLRRLPRLPDQPFFVVVIHTEQPGGAPLFPLPDDIIEMVLVPAFLSGIFPFAMGIHLLGATHIAMWTGGGNRYWVFYPESVRSLWESYLATRTTRLAAADDFAVYAVNGAR